MNGNPKLEGSFDTVRVSIPYHLRLENSDKCQSDNPSIQALGGPGCHAETMDVLIIEARGRVGSGND